MPRTVHTNELSEPAGIIPMGNRIATSKSSLLSNPFKTCIKIEKYVISRIDKFQTRKNNKNAQGALVSTTS
jgi:hypothetical protein